MTTQVLTSRSQERCSSASAASTSACTSPGHQHSEICTQGGSKNGWSRCRTRTALTARIRAIRLLGCSAGATAKNVRDLVSFTSTCARHRSVYTGVCNQHARNLLSNAWHAQTTHAPLYEYLVAMGDGCQLQPVIDCLAESYIRQIWPTGVMASSDSTMATDCHAAAGALCLEQRCTPT